LADYQLLCAHPDCGRRYETDDTFRLRCDGEISGSHGPAFLRARYEKQRLEVRGTLPGIFNYSDWLPTGDVYISPTHFELGGPCTYRSQGLSRHLGLEHLFVAFNGYWPEKDARLVTGSFKEFEAQATIARSLSVFAPDRPAPLMISSAGNTACGFNYVASGLGLPIYLVVPESGLAELSVPVETAPTLVVVRGDYYDAICVAEDLATETGLMREGGARNVARRAGLGVSALHSVAHPRQGSGALFDHYFQAVGSGTGAIAAHEAFQLLKRDGRFGDRTTRIHMVQNAPFTPVVDYWEAGGRSFDAMDDVVAKERISSVTAQVLTNRRPPYSIAGGLYDTLHESGGNAWRVTNGEIYRAGMLFRELEGIDIGPAAAAAVAALQQAVSTSAVGRQDHVLLHVTGGGAERLRSEKQMPPVRPTYMIAPEDSQDLLDRLDPIPVLPATIEGVLRYS
jgi:cysteate synthase